MLCVCIVYNAGSGSIAVSGSDFLVGECVCRPFAGRRLDISYMVSSTTRYLRARHASTCGKEAMNHWFTLSNR